MFGTRAFLQQIFNPTSTSNRRSCRRANQPRVVSIEASVEALEDRALLAALDEIPLLESRPGAPVTIYLDFDGHVENSQWNGGNTVTTPVYDIDGDRTEFSDEEISRIEQVYELVSEDFAPFDVNVSTEITPDGFAFNNFESLLVSIGGDGAWLGASAGGVAYLNSFSNSLSNTVYAFSDNLGRGVAKYIGLTTSHEVGHALGLQHHSEYRADGSKAQEYHPGTSTLGWIMGAPFDSEREVWYDGPANVSSTELQDDLAVMTSARNRTFNYLDDDHGNTTDDATRTVPNELRDADGYNVIEAGILERNGDIDVFEIQTDSTDLRLDVQGLDLRDRFNIPVPGTNTDLILHLWDENGNVIATSDPTGSLNASLTQTVTRGTYYAAVTAIDEYGALGRYTFRADVEPLPGIPVPISPSGRISTANPTFTWQIAGATDFYHIIVTNSETGQRVIDEQNLTGTAWVSNRTLPEGNYSWSIQGVDADGSTSTRSDELDFEVDIPAPAKPLLLTPTDKSFLDNGSPEFTWEDRPNITKSTLWVNNSEGVRVIYRTNIEGSAYTHFNELPNDKYRVWVQSFNAVGERSVWSDVVEFTVNTPAAGRSEILAPTGTTTNLRPTITWTNTGAARYDLWVNNVTLGRGQYIREQEWRTTSYTPDFDLDQGTYVAWVKGYNADGESEGWSNRHQFTVDIGQPTAPRLLTPTAGERETNSTPTFTWTAVANATHYDLWVNNRTLGESQIIRERAVEGTSFTPTEFLEDGEMVAWVRGVNEAGEVGPWSSALEFNLDAPAPAIPTITGPPTNAVGTSGPRTAITWTLVEFAARYELWVNSESQRKVIHETDLSAAEFTPDFDLADGERHVAWVRAFNAVGETLGWSQVYSWVVKVSTPATPIVLAPNGTARDANGDLTRTPTFEFTQAQDARTYEGFIRNVSTNEQFRFDIIDPRVNPDTQTIFHTYDQPLASGTFQFWVRGINAVGGAGGWSKSVTFVISSLADASDAAPAATPELMQGIEIADPEDMLLPTDDMPVEMIYTSIPQTPAVPAAPVEPVDETSAPDTEFLAASEPAVPQIAESAELEAVLTDWATTDLMNFETAAVTDRVETAEAKSTEESADVTPLAAAGLAALPLALQRLRRRNKRD